MSDILPVIRPVTQDVLDELVSAAAADDHKVFAPTHTVMKEGEVVGYFGAMPLVTFWMHTEKMKPRDTLHVIGTLEAMHANRGTRLIAVTCNDLSPFRSHMERLGYVAASPVFLKEL